MELSENEPFNTSKQEPAFLLTTRRVSFTRRVWREVDRTTVFLDKISAVQLRVRSWWVPGIGGAILSLSALVFCIAENYDTFWLLLSSGIFFLLLWWLSRRRVLRITVQSGRLFEMPVYGLSRAEAEALVYEIEEARRRYSS